MKKRVVKKQLKKKLQEKANEEMYVLITEINQEIQRINHDEVYRLRGTDALFKFLDRFFALLDTNTLSKQNKKNAQRWLSQWKASTEVSRYCYQRYWSRFKSKK